MGAFYETIPPSLMEWILAQKVFWIASSPLSASGHINLSPKGGSYFGLLSPTKFWYIDLTGSGVETLSHLQEPGNGRITVLFNAFEGAPRIVRLWGKGEVLEWGSKEFKDFVAEREQEGEGMSEKVIAGTRAVVVVSITQVGSSCGFSMPFYEYKGHRETLNEFFVKRVKAEEEGNRKDGIEKYWAYKNSYSMDGLPGLRRGVETSKRENVVPIKKMVGSYALESQSTPRSGPAFRSRFSGKLSSMGENVSLEQVVIVVLAFLMGGLVQYVYLSGGKNRLSL
ncbi:hypothetical protein VTL71DRAFT_10956 [Oculimacula yallundae]|uniref:Pyridoxamine 5'-phosphate oxidase putative domain-containing protein n=1 Tax=Oculimacula yallundae TaxID=86028 RepID=A0ABR4CUW5_9HELO